MGVYSFNSQCEMLAELGFNGITVSAWGGTPHTDLTQLPKVEEKYGLKVEALYVVLHEGRNDAVIRRLIETVEGVELIELAVQSSIHGLDMIFRFIESLMPIAERRGLRIALYPHLKHVTVTTQHVVSICERFNHPRLGASFNGYHWFASDEGTLEESLSRIKPWLMQVVLSGSSKSPLGWGGIALMEPPDRGEMDNARIIAALDDMDYSGSLGILGWDYCGDIYLKLERSLNAIRNIETRATRQSAALLKSALKFS
jgi:sugar phosphate isomerase/epimerase